MILGKCNQRRIGVANPFCPGVSGCHKLCYLDDSELKKISEFSFVYISHHVQWRDNHYFQAISGGLGTECLHRFTNRLIMIRNENDYG